MMKKNDKILITAVLVIGILAFALMSFRGDGKEVIVSQDGAETYRFDLNAENSIALAYGEDGLNELVIEEGKAYISHANCRDQICVEQGEIHEAGETIVCLPHKLVVEIR